MQSLSSARIRVLSGAVAGTLAVAVATVLGGPASADTRPPSSSTPTTVSTDVLPTAQLNGVAWTQLVVGNTVYVGGKFTAAQPAGAAAGSNTVARTNMLAYNLSTGALISGFAPSFNGDVRALAVSADGSTIYAGGAFTTVNGASKSRVAAVSATTGATVGGFAPSVNGSVYALARSGSTLYIGGSFTAVGSVARARAAAVSTSSGALTSWAPNVGNNAVRALVVNPDGTRVVLGGSFDTLNGVGSPYQGAGMVDTSTGKVDLPWSTGLVVHDHGTGSAIYSLSSDGSSVYGTGYAYNAGNNSNLEGMFSASWTSGSLRWVEDCHGDSYSNASLNGAVYLAGHPHFCGNIGGFPETTPRSYHRGLAFSTNATGLVSRNTEGTYANLGGNPSPSLLTWFPDFNAGTFTGQSQGPWSVAAGGNYVVYGGEFTTVNGQRQQGLARFALPSVATNKDGPRAGGADLKPTVTGSGSSVKVSWTSSWDRDNQQLTYRLYRGSTVIATVTGLSTFWNRPTLAFTDTGASGSVSYHVTASDPFGNTVTGSATTANVGGGGAAVAAPAAVADDTFTRSAAGDLGSADSGGAYTLTGTRSDYALDGSSARLSTRAGSTKRAVLGAVSSSDTDETVAVELLAPPAGGSAYAELLGRVTDAGDYRARVVLSSAGTVQLIAARGTTALRTATPGLSYAAGDGLRIRLQLVGANPTTVRAKVWSSRGSEPTAWQVTATDGTAALQRPGSVGFGSYLSSDAVNGPISFRFDDLHARPITP